MTTAKEIKDYISQRGIFGFGNVYNVQQLTTDKTRN
jgi:hypothetical protein